ncbi:MAG TPA: SPOR domain-containing protein [Kofleriaceae bacterium]
MPSREPELYKDKIEVSLDGRQIFYLFFGGAVIIGLVFVLGVLVGRRVEARGHLDRAETQAETDPLAALDRLERSDRLSFHGALRGGEAPPDVEKAIGDIEKRRVAGKTDKKPEPPEPITHPDKSDKRSDAAASADKKAKKHDDATDTRPELRSDGKPEAKSESKSEKSEKSEAKSEKSEAKSEPKSERSDAKRSDARSDKPVTRPDAKAEAREARADKRSDTAESKSDADARPSEPRVRFTLQLSSFQDKSEADAFLAATKSAGFQPYVVEADVTGKGTFYRVRLGSYRSLDAANDAKAEYERAAKKTAQVTRL